VFNLISLMFAIRHWDIRQGFFNQDSIITYAIAIIPPIRDKWIDFSCTMEAWMRMWINTGIINPKWVLNLKPN
jgi:hypothetical protein